MTKCSDCPDLFGGENPSARSACCMDEAKSNAYAASMKEARPQLNRKQRRAEAARERKEKVMTKIPEGRDESVREKAIAYQEEKLRHFLDQAPRLHVYARWTFDRVWADLEAEEALHKSNFGAWREWVERNAEFENRDGPEPGPRPRIAFPAIYYGMRTCWWAHSGEHLGALPPGPGGDPDFGGLPCDPRGGVLMQTDNWRDFLMKSRAKHETDSPDHGLARFMAAHHLNAFNQHGAHWAEREWTTYEAALVRAGPKTRLRLRRAGAGGVAPAEVS